MGSPFPHVRLHQRRTAGADRAHFSVSDRQSIFGHSMGGHGALMMAFRNPQRFRSVSAFAPIVNRAGCRGAARRSPPIWAATKASGCSTTAAICWPAARKKCRSLSTGATTTSSGRPAATGAVGGAGAPARLAADAAHSAGVRSQLLHHRHLRGRSPALPRRAPVPLIKIRAVNRPVSSKPSLPYPFLIPVIYMRQIFIKNSKTGYANSAIPSPLQFRIQRVAQSVAQQVEGQHGDEYRRAGKIATCGAITISARASLSIAPHSGVGGWAPSPETTGWRR